MLCCFIVFFLILCISPSKTINFHHGETSVTNPTPLLCPQDISHGNIDMWHFPYYQVFDCWHLEVLRFNPLPHPPSSSLPLPYKTNVRYLPQGEGAGYYLFPHPCENYTSDLRGEAMGILGGRGEETILNGQINASLIWRHFSIHFFCAIYFLL